MYIAFNCKILVGYLRQGCVYSFLPHNNGFSTNSVIKPAYELNIPPVVSQGDYQATALVEVEADNIIVEAIKPCEDNERAFIVRLYDAEGAYTRTNIKLFDGAKSVKITNMLEETLEQLADVDSINLEFRPFEIKTIKVQY
jgi:alpha-mannosidase